MTTTMDAANPENATSTTNKDGNNQQPDITPASTTQSNITEDNEEEEEVEIDLFPLKDDNNYEVKREEPNYNDGSSHAHASQPTRDSAASHLSEVRELRGLAKEMDEQDRIAKGKAKVGLGNTNRHSGSGVMSTASMATSAASTPERPKNRGLSVTQMEEKKRATYMNTGMQPGAYPGMDAGMEASDPVSDHNRYLTTRQYIPPSNNNNVRDIGVDAAEQEGRRFTNIEECSTQPSTTTNNHMEEGRAGYSTQNLVEAYVVPDEEAVVPPPVKAGTTAPTMISGDHAEKPQLVTQESNNTPSGADAENVKMTDLLLTPVMLKLIVCLICTFVILAVIIAVVIMSVTGGSSDSSNNNSSSSQTAVSPPVVPDGTFNNNSGVTMIPEATMDPLANNNGGGQDTSVSPVAAPLPGVTLAPSSFMIDGPEGATLPPSTINLETEQVVVTTLAPTTFPATDQATLSPTESTASPTSNVAAVMDTNAPTTSPVTWATPGPTDAPTFPQTPEPTPEPTPNPTPNPTDRPEPVVQETPQPTPNPTSAPVTAPVPAPVDNDNTAAYANSVAVDFVVLYTVNTDGEPSDESQAALNEALLEFFTDSLETGLELESQTLPQAQRIVSFQQRTQTDGWYQSVRVEYGWGANDLPDTQLIIDSFVEQSDVLSYLRDYVRPIGPYFGQTNEASFEFDMVWR